MSNNKFLQNFFNGRLASEGYGGFSGGSSDEGRGLLQNGELNLGALKDVSPSTGVLSSKTGAGVETRILELRGDSKLAKWVTITFNVAPAFPDNPLYNPVVGPLVGIVEFGNGSALNRVEVDIQQGNWLSTILPGPPYGNGFPLPSGGTMLSVPAGSLRVFARNDGGYQPLGDGNPIGNTTNTAKVTAHAAYGQKPAYEANTRSIALTSPTPQLAGFVNACGVPPFARGFTINRTFVNTTSLTIIVQSQYGDTISGPIIVPAGVVCPFIPLSGLARLISVTNDGPASCELLAVFNISL